MVHVIALLQAREGSIDRLIAAFREILPITRRKAGCLEYRLARHLDTRIDGQLPTEPDMLVVMETWTDTATLEAHLADTEYREWYSSVYPLLAGAGMQILEQINDSPDHERIS